ncbi:MAG TPA: hypothetical protein VNT27_08115, partial [Propionibacteriaceae bacterium]|nr:hypothetical protein [Propionibacteriaceae bacterium]
MNADRPIRDSAEPPLLLRRPELAPVLSRAMSAVINALELGEQPPPDLIRDLEHAAATAMTEAYEPIAQAASRLARSTETSRTIEAANGRKRAEETAALVSATTAALRQRHVRLVERVAKEAGTAARCAAASSVRGHKIAARNQADQVANSVRDAAAARSDQRAAAAILTAAAADQAAARLAIQADHAAELVERDAVQAAAAVQATALTIMYEIAIDAACRHFLVPLPKPDDSHAPHPPAQIPNLAKSGPPFTQPRRAHHDRWLGHLPGPIPATSSNVERATTMTERRKDASSSDGFNRPLLSRVDTLHPGIVGLENHPELIPLVQQAVDEVIASNPNRELDADLVNDVERAAAAAALTTYQRMVFSAIRVADAAGKAR